MPKYNDEHPHSLHTITVTPIALFLVSEKKLSGNILSDSVFYQAYYYY